MCHFQFKSSSWHDEKLQVNPSSHEQKGHTCICWTPLGSSRTDLGEWSQEKLSLSNPHPTLVAWKKQDIFSFLVLALWIREIFPHFCSIGSEGKEYSLSTKEENASSSLPLKKTGTLSLLCITLSMVMVLFKGFQGNIPCLLRKAHPLWIALEIFKELKVALWKVLRFYEEKMPPSQEQKHPEITLPGLLRWPQGEEKALPYLSSQEKHFLSMHPDTKMKGDILKRMLE